MLLVKKKKSLNFYQQKACQQLSSTKTKSSFTKIAKKHSSSFTIYVNKDIPLSCLFFLFQKISGEKSLIQLKEEYSWHDFCYMYGRNNLNNPTIKEFDHE